MSNGCEGNFQDTRRTRAHGWAMISIIPSPHRRVQELTGDFRPQCLFAKQTPWLFCGSCPVGRGGWCVHKSPTREDTDGRTSWSCQPVHKKNAAPSQLMRSVPDGIRKPNLLRGIVLATANSVAAAEPGARNQFHISRSFLTITGP